MKRLALVLLAAAVPGGKGPELRFATQIVDAAGPRDPWFKLVGDLDGDGQLDVVVGGRKGPLNGYIAPGWRKIRIAGGGYDGVDGETGDIDRDGDVDVVMGGLVWFENPGAAKLGSGAWASRKIDDFRAHDVELGDLDGDGDLDVVARDQSGFGSKAGDKIRIYRNDGKGKSWQKLIFDCPHGEGLKLADLDRDGDPDVVIGGRWYEAPADPVAAPWREHLFTDRWTHADAKVEVADLNGDKRADVVLAPAEHAGVQYKIAWYEAPKDPRAKGWPERVILEPAEAVVHALAAGDLDSDDQIDIVWAEMHQGKDPDEVVVLLNRGRARAGSSWQRQVISRYGSHNIELFDLGKDGDLDVLGANWGGPYQAVEIWENLRAPPRPLPLDKWRRHVIDAERSARAMFVLAADLDGDGRRDVASGDVWYRNPGRAEGGWKRQPIGEPLRNVAVADDFDRDGDLDLLGTQGRGAEANASFAWARNDGHGGFAVLKNLPAGEGDFLQGAVAWTGAPKGAAAVALSWHKPGKGVQLLTVPEDAAGPSWTWTRVSEVSQDEALSSGDLDCDGDFDLLLGTKWLRNNGGGSFAVETLTQSSEAPDRNVIADVNRDGRLDVVVGFEAINKPGKLAWYEAPAAGGGPWQEHLISDGVVGPMSLSVADMDRDGRPDVVVGEYNYRDSAAARLFVFEQQDDRGDKWRSHVVYTGDEHHDGAIAVDIDNDGDQDIVSIGWSHPRVLLYENLAIAKK